jgi:glycosyltransferase involved in cell wall biosynthesis
MGTPEPSEASGLDIETRSGFSEARARTPPKLAVIITCFNYEDFVERAIRSVLAQKRDDCELIVIDDGSTDGSWEVIRRCQVRAFNIDNRGQLAACIFGLDHTRAPFVLFLDADDELKPGSLAIIVDELDENLAKLQFALALIDADGNPMGTFSSLDKFRDRDLMLEEVLRRGVYKTPPTSGNVFRRDLCQLLREVDYDRAVDGVILFAAPLFGDVLSLSEELGCYRVHGRNDSCLGQPPTAWSLERDVSRFVARMEHLRAIVRRLAPDRELVESPKAFYYRERKFCLDIVSGDRPRLMMLPKLLAGLAAEPYSLRQKLAMLAFFVLGSVLPNERAKGLLAYRSKRGGHSVLGFTREILRLRTNVQS